MMVLEATWYPPTEPQTHQEGNMTPEQDAYGLELQKFQRGETVVEIIERDDGYIDAADPSIYFAAADAWPPVEREALRLAQGRVLDIGCGAGRVALHLQAQGCEVVAIDNSPLAVAVCRERGVVDARLLSITQVSRRTLGWFDAIVMAGNNFGLLANARRARWLLRRFGGMIRPGGLIIAQTLDPYSTDNPHHLAYQASNRRRGRMPGQIRIRVRQGCAATPWFDYLFVSPQEMAAIAADSGWRIAEVFRAPEAANYIAVLAPDQGRSTSGRKVSRRA
jgi:SAM-dependent methyltransferase